MGYMKEIAGAKRECVARDMELPQMEVCSDNLTLKLTLIEEKIPARYSIRRT